MEFKCIEGDLTWKGKINIFRQEENCIEFEITSLGKKFYIIIGKNYFQEKYICIPKCNIASELTSFKNIFWNTETLKTHLGEIDSKTIAKAVYIVADNLDFD